MRELRCPVTLPDSGIRTSVSEGTMRLRLMSHCLRPSLSNRGKPETASTYYSAITCSQQPLRRPDTSDVET